MPLHLFMIKNFVISLAHIFVSLLQLSALWKFENYKLCSTNLVT